MALPSLAEATKGPQTFNSRKGGRIEGHMNWRDKMAMWDGKDLRAGLNAGVLAPAASRIIKRRSQKYLGITNLDSLTDKIDAAAGKV